MNFIRPEARAALWRWRELLGALALLALGLRWALGGVGFIQMTGWACVALAVILGVVGAQRMRFRLGSGGPGVVQVTEGQISYFAPESGGMIAVRELSELVYDARPNPPVWTLRQAGLPELVIPANAKGAAQLFDAFAALPGLSADRLLTAQRGAKGHARVIWRKDALVRIDSTRPRLHS